MKRFIRGVFFVLFVAILSVLRRSRFGEVWSGSNYSEGPAVDSAAASAAVPRRSPMRA
ncbi:hypothetical protein OpiT1DRAFT_00091 [Opitutaceae bacterium TAV1]|nr:hypothetical protein OpiT1DRAFT_00091 [Opitutaceae bacterium TAV1]